MSYRSDALDRMVLHDPTRPSEVEAVRMLGIAIGFGNMMSLAGKLWAERLEEQGYPGGGAFVIGPCQAQVIECGCYKPHECDWCCGCGWLTKHVKTLKDKHEGER